MRQKPFKDGWQLLLQWLRGDAKSQHLRDLKEAAKADPFLSDAFDGYESFPGSNHPATITRLKAALRRRYTTKKRVPYLLLLQAAAVSLLLLAAGWLFLSLPGKPIHPVVADITEVQEGELPELEKTETIVPAPPQEVRLPPTVAKDKIPVHSNAHATTEPKKDFTESDVVEQEKPIASVQESKVMKPIPAPPGLAWVESNPSMNDAALDTGWTKMEAIFPVEESKVANDRSKTPTPSISIPADAHKLAAGKKESAYDPGPAPKKPIPTEDIAIPESKKRDQSNIADDEAFEKNGTADTNTPPEATLANNPYQPSPIGGWPEFANYMDNAIRSKAILPNEQSGHIVVQFEVNKRGVPGRIRIIQSTLPAYQKEVKKWLRAGPRWKKGLTGNRIGSCTIVFPSKNQ